jgi:hypothetical protein
MHTARVVLAYTTPAGTTTAQGNSSWHAAPQVSVFVLGTQVSVFELFRRCQYLCFYLKASKLSTCALECGELRLPYANWAVQPAA